MAKLEIRHAEKKDIEELVRVDKEAFSNDWFLPREYYEAWLEVFPEGFFVASLGGQLVGYASVEIIQHDINNPIPTWYEATDNGFIRKTHNPSGNTVYGVSFGVARFAPQHYIGKKLIRAAINEFIETKECGECGVIGSRIPNYHKIANQMTVEEYVYAKRKNGFSIDPLVTFYQRCGFRIVKILPNYIEDLFSLNYGVLMVFYPDRQKI